MPATRDPSATAIPDRPSSPKEGDAPPGPLYASWIALPAKMARVATERAKAEDATRSALETRLRRADQERREALEAAEHRHDTETAELMASLASLRGAANADHEREVAAIQLDRQTIRKTAAARHDRRRDEALKAYEAAGWEAGTIGETAERGAVEWRKEGATRLSQERRELETLREHADTFARDYRAFLGPKAPEPEAAELAIAQGDDPFPALRETIAEADATLDRMEGLSVPRFFRGPGMIWAFLVPLVVLAYPCWWLLGPGLGAGACVVLAAAIGFGLRSWIVATSREKLEPLRSRLVDLLGRGGLLAKKAETFLIETSQRRRAEAVARRDADLKKATEIRDKLVEDARRLRDEKAGEAEATAAGRLSESKERRDKLLAESADTERHRLEEIASQRETDRASATARHESARSEAQSRHQAEWDALADRWKCGLQDIHADVETIQSAMDGRFPSWDDGPPDGWTPPATLPEAIRFGTIAVPMDRVPGGVSKDETLRAMAPAEIRVPAILDFPERSSIAFEAGTEETRAKAIEAMQAVMLRMLSGLPPGKVRFTILDPVGLGRNFAGFMHLADYSEALVNVRIWTDPQQIDQKLAELNAHIETVIQSYLRNEFATIEDYNAQAAEVAEPYRVLVVADFPAGFTEATARRLAAIAKSGPRCGVYLILGIDTAQPLPPSVTRADLTAGASRVSWKEGRPILREPSYEPFPLELDAPPPADVMTRWLQRAGESARDANRVEVPFEVIAPAPEDYWKGDSGSSLSVPLGRSGATKLQELKLGRGTSQHVLIAGRTGSGKSTLLHALITNAALIYSPDQVEMYLIDFKKGVEFKTYATQGLPHARVVAIESEREFGLSVLQRLDEELKVRGDLFRDLGVQDLAGFRAAAPDRPMPRILFIVDEFQEFFVEDDKIAQESSLLLDRLVRQGRAFGIHAHLGSQTLSGAYSLARSTLGQMAVRIALQCSEADAQLILNEDNAAARLLSRPGEAIYNDANGQTEGNHIFQVVFLTDARREAYLKAIADLARQRDLTPRPRIVFEGNMPSDLAKNPAFAPDRNAGPASVQHAWMGEAVAIKDPTAAAFRAQGGSNLLIIGQNDEMAAGLVVAAALGLAHGNTPTPKLYALDGSPEDASFAGQLARVATALPGGMRVGGTRDTASILGEVAAEVERRQSESGDQPPVFLFLHDLARFRDLRKQEDDFGFGRKGEDKPVSPAKLLGSILRDGPPVGVHMIVWCDSLNNANRAFDRQALREFELRVLFQMSPADSSNLIDSPAASRLGANRALFATEEQGRLEKFRPYGLPSDNLLAKLRVCPIRGVRLPLASGNVTRPSHPRA